MIAVRREWRLSCLTLLVITACTKEVNPIKLTMGSSDIMTKGDSDYDQNTTVSCAGIDLGPVSGPMTCESKGTACGGPPVGAIRAGYDNDNDPGTQPCPCWSWENCIWRGYVKFDLHGQAPNSIVTATLQWKGTASGSASCATRLLVATEPWGNWPNGGDEISLGSTSKVDISPAVRAWVNQTQPNYGLYFVGSTESKSAHNNNKCYTDITNLSLQLVTSQAKSTWPQ